MIGTMMANETIKLITGIGEPLANQLLTYNSLNNRVYQFALSARKGTRSLMPENEAAFLQTDYEWLCSSQRKESEIDPDAFMGLIAKGNVDVIDVREPGEMPAVNDFSNFKIPLAKLSENASLIKSDTIVAFCQSGQRSLRAVKILSSIFGEDKKIYSLRGGIVEWKKLNQTI